MLLSFLSSLFKFCLLGSIAKMFHTQRPRLLIYVFKSCSGAPFLSLKTAPSILVWHFNMSPDPKASHYTRLADLTLSQHVPVRLFTWNINHLGESWLTPLCVFILDHTIYLIVWSWKMQCVFYFSAFTFSLLSVFFFNMSPRVAICMQLLSPFVCMWVIKLPSNRAEKREHTLIYVSRQKYEIELMCSWFMWMHKTLGEHIWWKLKIHWKQKRGFNVYVDISLSSPKTVRF